MSKMSQLHAELTEQAYELGFESLDEALANGYEVDYEEKQLVNPYVLLNKVHEEAHEEWLKEKEEVLAELNSILNAINGQTYNNLTNYELLTFIKSNKQIIAKAIEFIARGEM